MEENEFMARKNGIGNKDDIEMAKLIKLYIITHQGCTSKDISVFFQKHKFGINSNYMPRDITHVIKHYMSISNCKWFDSVEIKKDNYNKLRFYVKR